MPLVVSACSAVPACILAPARIVIRIHGSCVAVDGAGVLFRGPSGSGKSDLSLRLIDEGGALVADDQVLVARGALGLVAACPPAISGRLEVRGVGIMRVPHVAMAAILLVVDLVPAAQVERLPRPRRCRLEQVELPLLALFPFEPSAPAKVRLALRSLAADSASFR
jgi:HPr kinase/phosphorylase